MYRLFCTAKITADIIKSEWEKSNRSSWSNHRLNIWLSCGVHQRDILRGRHKIFYTFPAFHGLEGPSSSAFFSQCYTTTEEVKKRTGRNTWDKIPWPSCDSQWGYLCRDQKPFFLPHHSSLPFPLTVSNAKAAKSAAQKPDPTEAHSMASDPLELVFFAVSSFSSTWSIQVKSKLF